MVRGHIVPELALALSSVSCQVRIGIALETFADIVEIVGLTSLYSYKGISSINTLCWHYGSICLIYGAVVNHEVHALFPYAVKVQQSKLVRPDHKGEGAIQEGLIHICGDPCNAQLVLDL